MKQVHICARSQHRLECTVFLRMPFGISSAPEIFQKIMNEHFSNIDGVGCYEDDLCVWSETIEEHCTRLKTVFEKARKCGLKFNAKKCEFLKEQITYLGHILTKDGVSVDPSKVSAIKEMPSPTNKQGLQRFLGMVTYLTKFLPNMSAETAALRLLLEKDTEWIWSEHQQNAFDKIKSLISSCPVLRFF